MGDTVNPPRGVGDSVFREVRCKDCLRELLIDGDGQGLANIDTAIGGSTADLHFEYSEAAAQRMLDRGGSRSDRCPKHRREHNREIQSVAVAYVDLRTIGEIADGNNPTGPLGGLGELPTVHSPRRVTVNLAERQFGMTDDDIRTALRHLANPDTRVLVLRAGTGTGKSTFAPYRLMNPPSDQPGDEQLLQLTSLGPIVVTEPRVQATTGVARFVGEKLVANCKWKVCSEHGRFVPGKDATPDAPEGPDHPNPIDDTCVISDCVDHIGPGQPVGYQVKDDKKHDDACQLVYVTDGTMVNWLGDGRLSKIGTVIVDEAHERSRNIDFIMGELKRQVERYPHLRVVITSATFDVDYFVAFYGGPERVASMDVPAVKTVGYGAPLFPYSDGGSKAVPPCVCLPADPTNPARSLHKSVNPSDYESWLLTHWPDPELREVTRQLECLRFQGPLLDPPDATWGRGMKDVVVGQLIKMVTGLDEMTIAGDILAFLPTTKMIEDALAQVRAGIGSSPTDVFGLIGSMPKELQAAALAARPPGARRKVVIATNLAETSLTVEGVRFVVDSGIITQSTWNPTTASGDMPTGPHSQSGIRQRWGRVGRDAPGWVLPLYTTEQFKTLPLDTPPGATRENLEQLAMTAKAGGVDDLADFPWPADFEHESMDDNARASRDTFRLEMARATRALALNGFVDEDGHMTPFGKEVQRFSVTGVATSSALAIMIADQLACVPELIAALHLLEVKFLVGPNCLIYDNNAWQPQIRAAATLRMDSLTRGCTDDLDFVLRIAGAWDRSDPNRPPWEITPARRRWCGHWWLNPTVLQVAAQRRREVLAALSPNMTEEVKRHVDPRLAERVRAVLSHSLTSVQYVSVGNGAYESCADDSLALARIDRQAGPWEPPERLIALRREEKRQRGGNVVYLKHIIRTLPWALDENLDVFRLIERAAMHVSPRMLPNNGEDPLLDYIVSWPVGMGFQGTLTDDAGRIRVNNVGEISNPRWPPGVAVVADDGDPTLTSKDSNWLLGAPLGDEEELLRKPVDTADDPNDPEKGMETNDDESTIDLVDIEPPEDVLAGWQTIARHPDVDHPLATMFGDGPPAKDPTWFSCLGFETGADTTISVILAGELAVAEVRCAAADRGKVYGRRHENLRGLQAMNGIVSCDFDGNEGPLQVIGDVAAVRTAVTKVLSDLPRAQSGRSTGVMQMPSSDKAGHLIGRGGATRDDLVRRAGCTSAWYAGEGVDWEVIGPSPESVRSFVSLADAQVPGCELRSLATIAPTEGPVVRDLVSGTTIASIASHIFGTVPMSGWPASPLAPDRPSEPPGDAVEPSVDDFEGPESPWPAPLGQPSSSLPAPAVETPTDATGNGVLIDVRERCEVVRLPDGRVMISDDSGRVVTIHHDDYRRDSRPLHWLREGS